MNAEEQLALIDTLRKQIEEVKTQTTIALQEKEEKESLIQQQQLYTQKLMRTLKQKENITKELEEKLQVTEEGGTDRLAVLETVNDSYLESIESELERVELDVMSIGDLSRLLLIYSKQIERVNEERDRRTLFIQTRIETLENKM